MKKDKKKLQNKVPSEQTERMKFWGSVALIIIILGYTYNYFADPANFPDNSSQVTAQTGAQLFEQHCASCHGQGGVGQDIKKPKGGLFEDDSYIAPALNGTGHAWHHKTEDLFNNIKFGSMEPTSAMKGFEERLSDEEISKIIEYFQSLWPPEIKERYDQM